MKFLVFACAAASLWAQAPAPTAASAQEEIRELGTAISEGGNSPQDYIRVLEAHLRRFPNSIKRNDIELALAKASIEASDRDRTIDYGLKVIDRGSNDVELIDHVAHALLDKGDAQSATKVLELAAKYQEAVKQMREQPATGRITPAQWQFDLDRLDGRALLLKSGAQDELGHPKEALGLVEQSFKKWPAADTQRMWGKLDAASGNNAAAIEHYADAFTLEDPRSTEVDRAKDRLRLGELWVKAHGSEQGLGDAVLSAYDRMSALMAERQAELAKANPNAKARMVLDFTLPGADGKDLALASLKGKTIVFDFWATWCGPCRAQRPLYEAVERKFAGKNDVVFLSVDTDDDHSTVPEFLKKQGWTQQVYYDGGLCDYLKVSHIPTTVVVGPQGEITSRMDGYIPDRFVELLSERIQEARK